MVDEKSSVDTEWRVKKICWGNEGSILRGKAMIYSGELRNIPQLFMNI